MTRRPPSRARRGLAALTVVLLAGCGETYVDQSLIAPSAGDSVPTTTTGGATDAVDTPDTGGQDGGAEGDAVPGFATALARIDDALDRLSDAVADDPELAADLLTTIDDAWASIEAGVRARYPDQLFGVQQAIDLAHSAVTRKRPADASKAWKILRDVAPTIG